MVSAAVAAVICGCGHAERLHERDSAAEDDRGVCLQSSCGCSEFRLRAAEAAASAYESLAAKLLPCPVDGCDRRFESPQGVAMHRRRVHEGYDPNVKPDAGPPSPVPDQATDGPREVTAAFASELAAVPQSGRDTEDRGDPHRGTQEPPEGAKQGPSHVRSSAPAGDGQAEDVLASPGTPTREEDPAAEVGDAPDPAAGPARDDGRRHSITAYIDLGEPGWIELRIEEASAAVCLQYLDLITPFLRGGA